MSDDRVTPASNAALSHYPSVTAALRVPDEFHIPNYAIHPLETEISVLTGLLWEKLQLKLEPNGQEVGPKMLAELMHNGRLWRLKMRIYTGNQRALKDYIASKTVQYENELERLHSERINHSKARWAPGPEAKRGVAPVAILSRQAWIASRAQSILKVGNRTNADWHTINNLLRAFYEEARWQPESAYLVRKGDLLMGATAIFVEHASAAAQSVVKSRI